MASEVAILYDNARKEHAKGILLLENKFGYHPAFKRPGDSFRGIIFQPA